MRARCSCAGWSRIAVGLDRIEIGDCRSGLEVRRPVRGLMRRVYFGVQVVVRVVARILSLAVGLMPMGWENAIADRTDYFGRESADSGFGAMRGSLLPDLTMGCLGVGCSSTSWLLASTGSSSKES